MCGYLLPTRTRVLGLSPLTDQVLAPILTKRSFPTRALCSPGDVIQRNLMHFLKTIHLNETYFCSTYLAAMLFLGLFLIVYKIGCSR